jgi:anti-sigma regulatory factor (Ser/Thr protein kinase)
MTEQRSFANTPAAVARARRFVALQLADAPSDVVEEIAIMVSELATNCVRHTVTDFTVSVERTERGILVEVTDSGGGMPTVRRPEPSEPSGRGLRIVQELADSFGVRELRGTPGKTVWFVVGLEEPAGRTIGERPATRGLPQELARPDVSDAPRRRRGRTSDSSKAPEARGRCVEARGLGCRFGLLASVVRGVVHECSRCTPDVGLASSAQRSTEPSKRWRRPHANA